MNTDLTPAGPTPSQTIGPFFGVGLGWMSAHDLVEPGSNAAVTIEGRILDGAADPVSDALVEIWQADADGHLAPGAQPGWTGFGRCLVDADGRFRFTTVKPGVVACGEGAAQAPHINVSVFARGLLQRLVTRIYFPNEATANSGDPLLQSIPDPAVRQRLVASGFGGRFQFDIHLQGGAETPFFDY